MKKNAKKTVAIMLSLVMLLGCVPSFINEASANEINTIADVLETVDGGFPTSATESAPNNAWKSIGGYTSYVYNNGIYFEHEDQETFPINSNVTKEDNNYINGNYGITFVMTDEKLTSIHFDGNTYEPVKKLKSLTDLATLIEEANPGDTIVLDSDYMFTDGVDTNSSIKIDKELSITMQGHTIDGNDKTDVIFRVDNGGKLIFNNSTGCIKNARQGNVNVGGGGVVVSNYCKMDGGQDGFYVGAGGTLVCNNVYITNMTHAGMSIAERGLLIFDGGIISDCKYGIYLKGTGYFGTQPIVKENDDYNILFFNSADIYTGAYSNINETDYSSHNMNSNADLSFYCSYLKDTDKEMVLAHGHENNSDFVNYIKIENADCNLSVNDKNEFIIKHIIKKLKFRLFPEGGLILQSDIDNILEYRKTAVLSGADEFSLSYGDVEGKYYELIDFSFGSKEQADLIETIEFEGIDITANKITDNITRDNVRDQAFTQSNGCAWARLDDKTIIAAKYLKPADIFEVKYSGLVVGSKIDDVKVDQFTFNGVEDNKQGMSIFEVTNSGDNVKAILNSDTFEANKKYLICSSIQTKSAENKFDNTAVFINGERITNEYANSPSGTDEKETGYKIDSLGIFYCYVFTPSNPPSSGGSKKYKANDNDTAEKVSGSGKKGSTRTIVPEAGRKVSNVTVTDKEGNPIEVTMNEDGTYSFIQPASDVIIDVDYKAREIMMEVGTIGAIVDGIGVNEYVTPKVRNNEVMLPVRFIAENLGAKVDWNEKEPNMIYITRGDKKIEIKLGSNIIKVNGEEITLDSASFAEENRTYVPLKLIEKALDATVELGNANSNEILVKEF